MQHMHRRTAVACRGGLSGISYGCGVSTLVLSLFITLVAPSASAASAPRYADLLNQSLASAPVLLEQAANVRAAGAEARQARAWLNPSLNAVYENIGGPQSDGGSQRQDTYSITQPVEIGGKRGARIEAGDQSFAAAQARSHQAQITFSAQLAVAYAAAEAMQVRKGLAAEELVRAKDDLRIAQALVKTGKEAELRVVQAQSSVAAAQAAVQAAIADATEALERLSALAGIKEAYSGIEYPFLAEATAHRLNTNEGPVEAPAVVSAMAERQALAAQVGVEEKRWIPDIGLSAGVRKFGWTNDNALVVGISAAIPVFDRNRNGIAAARERVMAADARLEAARLEAAAARRAATAQLEAAEQRVEAALQGESTAAEAYRLGRIGYDAGKTSLLEVLTIRRALTDARLLTIDARLARVRALALLSIVDGRIAFGDLK